MAGKGRWPWLVVAAVSIAMVFCASATAAGPQGTGPDQAATPSGEWVPLTAGSEHWYVFLTPGKSKGGSVPDVKVEVQVAPVNGATFSVWTPEELQRKAKAGPGEVVDPVGRGAPQELDSLGFVQRLLWQGGFTAPGKYYVAVMQAGPADAAYLISITGNEISFPTAAAEKQHAAAVAPVAIPVDLTRDGSGPANAFLPDGQWRSLDSGEGDWFEIYTTGPDDGGNGPQITVELLATPPGSANFCVWTPEGLRVWEKGSVDETNLPVGRSSELELANDESIRRSVWSGHFNEGGKYYVCVRQQGSHPTSYALKVDVE